MQIFFSSLKKTKVKLELSIDIDMLLMVEKGTRGRTCHATDLFLNSDSFYNRIKYSSSGSSN